MLRPAARQLNAETTIPESEMGLAKVTLASPFNFNTSGLLYN